MIFTTALNFTARRWMTSAVRLPPPPALRVRAWDRAGPRGTRGWSLYANTEPASGPSARRAQKRAKM
jgi:hypothetical protein